MAIYGGQGLGKKKVSPKSFLTGGTRCPTGPSHTVLVSLAPTQPNLVLICPRYSSTGREGLGPPNCPQRRDENSGKSGRSPRGPPAVKCLDRSLFQRQANGAAHYRRKARSYEHPRRDACPPPSCPRTVAHALPPARDALLLISIQRPRSHLPSCG